MFSRTTRGLRSATCIAVSIAPLALATATVAQTFETAPTAKIQPVLKTSRSWDGSPLNYPSGQAEYTAVTLDLAAGADTGWHSHDAPSFVYVLDGSLDVVTKDGRVNHVTKGQGFAELVGGVHDARNVGPGTLRLLVLYTGAVGQKLMIKTE